VGMPVAPLSSMIATPVTARIQLILESQQASTPHASPCDRGTWLQRRAKHPIHMTFHVDKTRHCYSPMRHDCQQNRDGTARACVPPPCWASGAARNSRYARWERVAQRGLDKMLFFLAAGFAQCRLHVSDAAE
jgi:hypothetical protein